MSYVEGHRVRIKETTIFHHIPHKISILKDTEGTVRGPRGAEISSYMEHREMPAYLVVWDKMETTNIERKDWKFECVMLDLEIEKVI